MLSTPRSLVALNNKAVNTIVAKGRPSHLSTATPLPHVQALATEALQLGVPACDVQHVINAVERRDARARWAVVAAREDAHAVRAAHTTATRLELHDAVAETTTRWSVLVQRAQSDIRAAMHGRVSARRVHGMTNNVDAPRYDSSFHHSGGAGSACPWPARR